MKVVVETPAEFQGSVMGLLNQRRGMIIGSQDEDVMCVIEAQVPLAENVRIFYGFYGRQHRGKPSLRWNLLFTGRFRPQSIAEKLPWKRLRIKKQPHSSRPEHA
jgi:elongation factor G